MIARVNRAGRPPFKNVFFFYYFLCSPFCLFLHSCTGKEKGEPHQDADAGRGRDNGHVKKTIPLLPWPFGQHVAG